MPHQLVRDTISRDMEQLGPQIAEGIASGQITGIVFGLAVKGRRYVVNVAGTFARDPTLARGVVCAIDDELSRMVQGRTDSDTTI